MFSREVMVKGAIAAGIVKAEDIMTSWSVGPLCIILTNSGENVKLEGYQTVVAGTVNYGVRSA